MNLVMQNRRLTSPQLKKKHQAAVGGTTLLVSTIKNCLKEARLPARVVRPKPVLTAKHLADCLAWARDHVDGH